MSDPRDLRVRSRNTVTSDELSWEAVNAGSLQRIADATEKMAASYDSMRNARDYWKERAERHGRELVAMERRVRSLRGVITRMRKAKA